MDTLLTLLELLIMAAAIMCGVEIIGLSYYLNKKKYEERRKRRCADISQITSSPQFGR